MISANIIADSVNHDGDRLTTFVVTFPRIVLSELNTHRAFSRNSASSRAIPFKRMIDMVRNEPFIPYAWQKSHTGMQGEFYFTKQSDIERLNSQWLDARDDAIIQSSVLNQKGVTKQLCNRLLEPFMYHTAIVTATDFENFFHLRCPQYQFDGTNDVFRSIKDANKIFPENSNRDGSILDWFSRLNKGQAEIHISILAEKMWDAYNESSPNQLNSGEWHIPFGDNIDEEKLKEILPSGCFQSKNWYIDNVSVSKVKVATARCARVSYLNFEGKDDYVSDVNLHDRLLEQEHYSPFEHCARAMPNMNIGNFKGFYQYRHIIQNSQEDLY